ncbi:hypothetical protein LCGC14_1267790 [marine sediment metagenome]|uniref:Uncharacterized protein n=1 Tax=marine sediment metagenome TaxID=412755 RepID=A0A0F9L0V2_9ZZZZ
MSYEELEKGGSEDSRDKAFKLSTKNAFITGFFLFKENLLYIHAFSSDKKGDFKFLMNEAVKKFSTNKIIFTNILNPEFIFKKLKGFTPFNHYWEIAEEYILCGRGEWVS